MLLVLTKDCLPRFGGKDKSPDLKMKRKMKANFRAQKDTCWWGNVETPVQTQMRARPSREDTFSGRGGGSLKAGQGAACRQPYVNEYSLSDVRCETTNVDRGWYKDMVFWAGGKASFSQVQASKDLGQSCSSESPVFS